MSSMNVRPSDTTDCIKFANINTETPRTRHLLDHKLAAVTSDSQELSLTESYSPAVGGLICAWPNCQPGILGERPQNLPISDRILGMPTASSAKMGEVAMISQADEGGEIKSRKKKIKRLGCLCAGFVTITVLMLVL